MSEPEIPLGLCQCGCGQATTVATRNQPSRGLAKGVPMRYVYAHNQRKRPEDRVPHRMGMSLHTSERDYGVIVSCKRIDEEKDQRTIHEPGGSGKALRAACERIDRWGGEWRICAISSPPTIWRDIQASRIELNDKAHHAGAVVFPELRLLAGIGRADLWIGQQVAVTAEPRRGVGRRRRR